MCLGQEVMLLPIRGAQFLCPITSDVHFDHLLKVATPKLLHCEFITPFPLYLVRVLGEVL